MENPSRLEHPGVNLEAERHGALRTAVILMASSRGSPPDPRAALAAAPSHPLPCVCWQKAV